MNKFNFTYDISFNETFFTATMDKPFELQFLKDIYNNDKNQIIFSLEKPKPVKKFNYDKSEIISSSNLIDNGNGIIEDVKKSKIHNQNFNLGLEYIRTDKKGNEILMRKMEYPLMKSNLLSVDEDIIELENFIYHGAITIPFKVYTKEKEDIYQKSKYKNSSFTYYIHLIPMDTNGDSIKFKVYFSNHFLNGSGSRGPEIIELTPGQKFKYALKLGETSWETEVDGKRIKLSTKDDFRAFVDEYLILSLEK
jgi:hypothetical protein